MKRPRLNHPTEALATDDLAEIVHDAVEKCFDLNLLAGQIAEERADRMELLHQLPAGGKP